MKNILIITLRLSVGGTERFISVISNSLVEQGYNVNLIIYNKYKKEYKLNNKIKIFYLDETCEVTNKFHINKIDKIRHVSMIRKIIKKISPDYCMPFLNTPIIDTYLASRGLSVPLIVTMRNVPQHQSYLNKRIIEEAFDKADGILLQNQLQKQFVKPKLYNKIIVVPNAVDDVFLSVGKKRKYIKDIKRLISVGRLVEQKNQTLLIEAMSIVHKYLPSLTLCIFGEGDQYKNLKNMIIKKNLVNTVFLMGQTKCIHKELLKADMFLFGSNFEGMPNALMEAMATGLPCISTDCPTGPKDLIGKENLRGILIPLGDHVEMAKSIIYLCERTDIATSMGLKAHEYIANHYSIASVSQRFINKTEEVINNET